MAANGFPAAPAIPAGAQLMVTIGRFATSDGLVKITAGGSQEGMARFWLEMTVFGDLDPTAFLGTIAKALSEQRSRIVRPS